jgi:ribosomal protein S12 methylthiotransferase
MGRRTDGRHIRRLFERIRREVPGIAIRSSAMVGFPGETDAEFRELLDFVLEGNVDHLGVFEYSPEPGTAAHSLPDRVDPATAAGRARQLIGTMEELTAERSRSMTGSEVTVMVDEPASVEDGLPAIGRTAGQAWEMDGVVIIDASEELPSAGGFARVRVTGAAGFDLTAELASVDGTRRGRGETA